MCSLCPKDGRGVAASVFRPGHRWRPRGLLASTMTELLQAATILLAVFTAVGEAAALAAHRWTRRVSAEAERIVAGGDAAPPPAAILDGGELFDRLEAGANHLQAHRVSFTIRGLALLWTLISGFLFVAAAAAWAISAVLA